MDDNARALHHERINILADMVQRLRAVAFEGCTEEKVASIAMKCKHQNNLVISVEETVTSLYTRFSDGTTVVDSDPGSATGKLSFHCRDCGYQKAFGRTRPQWLVMLLAEFDNK